MNFTVVMVKHETKVNLAWQSQLIDEPLAKAQNCYDISML